MPRVRRADPAWNLVAVERQGICAEVLAPKSRLEILSQNLRLAAQLDLQIIFAHAMRELRRMNLRGKHIALHFAKRDRPFRQLAAGVKDRIIGILPALINKARSRLPRIFNEAVPIRIAKVGDPLQSRLDIRPDGSDRSDVPGPGD